MSTFVDARGGSLKANRNRRPKGTKPTNRWSPFAAPKEHKGMSDAFIAAHGAQRSEIAKEWRAFRKSLPKGVRV